jgi:Nucleotidyl transferase AbiEii toxin, Type IV TA system
MLLVWLGEATRPTRDADLLGFGDINMESLREIFTELCVMEVESDGLEFDESSLRVAPIRVENVYGGQRATLVARLGAARLKVQVDVGVGDAVFPDPNWIEYPSLLDFPKPRLRAYSPETTIAEKLHAMVDLGTKNSRMRDFRDLRTAWNHRSCP